MRKVVVNEWMTLDGVVQGPGYADEDTDGGFTNGGWHLQYFDDMSRNWVVDGYTSAGGFLLGRQTYENFASYWPNAPDEERAVAKPLNSLPKYVATTTLEEPLEWENSMVLEGDVAQAVAALKREDGGDLHVIGSPALVQTLIENELVDSYRLMIDPVVVGGGKQALPNDVQLNLELLDERRFGNSVVHLHYRTKT